MRHDIIVILEDTDVSGTLICICLRNMIEAGTCVKCPKFRTSVK